MHIYYLSLFEWFAQVLTEYQKVCREKPDAKHVELLSAALYEMGWGEIKEVEKCNVST